VKLKPQAKKAFYAGKPGNHPDQENSDRSQSLTDPRSVPWRHRASDSACQSRSEQLVILLGNGQAAQLIGAAAASSPS